MNSRETRRKEPQLCLSHCNVGVVYYCTALAQSDWQISHIYFETVSYSCTFSLVNSRLTKPFKFILKRVYFDSTFSKRICGSLQGCYVKKNVKWFSLQIFCSVFLHVCSPKTLACSFLFFFGNVFESLCCICETTEILRINYTSIIFFLNERKKWKMIVGGGHQEDMYVDWPVNQIWAFETLQAFPGPWNVYLAYCSHS